MAKDKHRFHETAVREYDIRQPDVFIEGRAGSGPLEVFEFPACVLTAGIAVAIFVSL